MLPPAASRRHTATATASSGSSSSGGSAAPAPSWYPPPWPRLACTGYPRSRSRSTSRRTLRVVTPSRSASSSPLHTRRDCSSPSSRSTRLVVSDTSAACHIQRTEVVRYHPRSEEHTSELQSRENIVCRPLLEKKEQ